MFDRSPACGVSLRPERSGGRLNNRKGNISNVASLRGAFVMFPRLPLSRLRGFFPARAERRADDKSLENARNKDVPARACRVRFRDYLFYIKYVNNNLYFLKRLGFICIFAVENIKF